MFLKLHPRISPFLSQYFTYSPLAQFSAYKKSSPSNSQNNYESSAGFPASSSPRSSSLSSQPQAPSLKSLSSFSQIVEQRRKSKLQLQKKMTENLPAQNLNLFVQEHLCKVVLFMRHDELLSQYVYAIMNYQKLGFDRVNDYSMLKSMGKFVKHYWKEKGILKGKDGKEKQISYPIVKFNVPLRESYFLVGEKEIIKFLNENYLFQHQIQGDQTLAPTIQKYVNQNVLPHLQTLFWHPSLNLQRIFHVKLSQFGQANINYNLVKSFHSLMFRSFTSTISNITKILFNRKIYLSSRQNLETSIKQLQKILLSSSPPSPPPSSSSKQNPSPSAQPPIRFFSTTSKPSHLDFYIFAAFSTKLMSKSFQKYMREQVGGQFWVWIRTMRGLTQYDKERITLI